MNESISPYREGTIPEAKAALPLVWQPRAGTSVAALADYVKMHREGAEAALLEHGAILVRGFDINSADDVETLAAAFVADLGSDYLGTSPRNAVTPRVFNASELPGFYPIPQHCEMTFVKAPPERIFFSCLVAPAPGSGETPITDFAAVAASLSPELRAKFEQRDLRLIRNYSGPSSQGRRDLWQLKRWDEMFATTDREVVEKRCRDEGFEPQWIGEDGLRLVSTHRAIHTHPTLGIPVWFNHLQVFHLAAGPSELRRIAQMRPGLRSWFWFAAARVMAAQKSLKPDIEQAMHMTWADGEPIARADVEAVLDAIWKNQVVFAWQKGDFLAVDNRRVSHGRLPYRGPRKVVVAWS
jgi:alpha-ketoglutarate-dependent taurine dioxygenase